MFWGCVRAAWEWLLQVATVVINLTPLAVNVTPVVTFLTLSSYTD